MEHPSEENNVFAKIKHMDLKNMASDNVLRFSSIFSELSLEDTEELIKHYPKFADSLVASLKEYKTMLADALHSDDASVQAYYDHAGKELNHVHESRKLFLDTIHTVLEDYGKLLDREHLSDEMIRESLDREKIIVEMASHKDK